MSNFHIFIICLLILLPILAFAVNINMKSKKAQKELREKIAAERAARQNKDVS